MLDSKDDCYVDINIDPKSLKFFLKMLEKDGNFGDPCMRVMIWEQFDAELYYAEGKRRKKLKD